MLQQPQVGEYWVWRPGDKAKWGNDCLVQVVREGSFTVAADVLWRKGRVIEPVRVDRIVTRRLTKRFGRIPPLWYEKAALANEQHAGKT